MCGSGFPTLPLFFTPYPKFFLQILKLEENIILFCYSFPTSELGGKNHLNMTIRNAIGIGSKRIKTQ